jgi:hypothetical protein
MLVGKIRIQKKWLILGLGCLLLPLYQNMSPFDQGDSVDIRDYAPRKPAGYLDNPMAAYVPGDFAGSNLSQVGESLLSHNFDSVIKRTEFLGVSLFDGEDSFTTAPDAHGGYGLQASQSNKLRLDVLGPSQLRLSYHLAASSGSGWNMSCQADPGSRGLSLQMNHPLSSKVNLGVSHETEARLSQLKMGIAW